MLDGYATYARRHTQKTFVTIHFSLKKVHSLNWAPVIPLWAVCTLQPSTYGAWKFKMGIITHRCFYYGIFIHFSIVLWDFRNFYFMACDTQICSGKSFTDRCLLAKFLRSLFMKRDWHYLSAPELSVFAFLPFTLFSDHLSGNDLTCHPLSIFHSQTFLQRLSSFSQICWRQHILHYGS